MNPNMGQQPTPRAHIINYYQTLHQRNANSNIPQQPWQTQVGPEIRVTVATQLNTAIRILRGQEVSDTDIMKQAIHTECQIFGRSQSKEDYESQVKAQLHKLMQVRQNRIEGAPNGMPNGLNHNPAAMMGQPGMGPPRPNGPQQFPQAFPNPQLQRQMQSSPLPGNRQPMMAVNPANPAANGFQQGLTPQANMQRPPAEDPAVLTNLAHRLMRQANQEQKTRFQQEVDAWPADKKQELQRGGIDPLFLRFRQQAASLIQSGRLSANALQALRAQNPQGMQQPSQPNQMPLNMNQRQPIDYNALENQQIEARRVQETGQQVVPASNNANASPLAAFPGQNPQRTPNLAQRQAIQATMNGMQMNPAAQAQAHARAQLQLQQNAQQPAHLQGHQQQLQQQLQQQQGPQAQGIRGPPNQLLQGQLGGLMPPGPSPSPGMPMLTRPVVAPPGQPNPSTPQQPQAHVPPMTGANNQMTFNQQQHAARLAHQAQQRAQQAQQGQQVVLNEQVRRSMIPAGMAPPIAEQLLKLPDNQFRASLHNFNQRNSGNPAMQGVPFPPGQPTLNQQNMMTPNPAMMGMQPPVMGANPAMSGLQNMNFAQQANNGMPIQRPPNAQPQNMSMQQQLHNAQTVLQQNPGIIQLTDNMPFPPGLIPGPLRQMLPQDVKTWLQLKRWAQVNGAAMPHLDPRKISLYQVVHFQQAQARRNAGMPGAPNAQQVGTGPFAPPGPMGAVPQQVRTPHQEPNIQAMGLPQITPQELQNARARLPPQQRNISDDQLRGYLVKQKVDMRNKQLQQAHQQQQLQQSQQQPPNLPPAQPAQGPSPMPTQQPLRPPTAQAQAVQPTPPPKSTPKTQPSAKPAQPSAPMNVKQGVKRPNEDGSHYPEATASSAAPQAPVMAASRSQQGVAMTPDQANQSSQMRAHLLKAQDASSNPKTQQRSSANEEDPYLKANTQEMINRIRAMSAEEEQRLPRGPPVQVDAATRAQMAQIAHKEAKFIKMADMALRVFVTRYTGTDAWAAGYENTAREVLRTRIKIFRNLNTKDGSLRDDLTMGLEDFRKAFNAMSNFARTVFEKVPRRQPNNAPQSQPGQQGPAGSGTQAQPAPAQLTPANLAINDIQQRQQQKVPSAPVVARPPYPIGAQLPHGAPTYFETAPDVPQHLKLPDKKKARYDNQGPAAGSKPSPRPSTGKDASPDRRAQVAPRPEQKPVFRCTEPGCDAAGAGFETQALLDAHMQEAHGDFSDPVQYALDSVTYAFDLDPQTGQPKKANADAKAAQAPGRPAAQASKTGQTPGMPPSVTTPAGQQPGATPMARVPTATGAKGSPSTNLLKTPQTGAKAATPSTTAPGKATPASVAKPVSKEAGPSVGKGADEESESLPFAPLDLQMMEDPSATEIFNNLTVLDLHDQDNTWALRDDSPPRTTPGSTHEDTPESNFRNTPTTRKSDISENDNLRMEIDLEDPDANWAPTAWVALQEGTGWWPPFNPQVSRDMDLLGVPMPNAEQELFPDLEFSSKPILHDDILEHYGIKD
jgi:hypothetical protein